MKKKKFDKKKLAFLLSEYNANDNFAENIHTAILKLTANAPATECLLQELEVYVESRAKTKLKLRQFGFTNADEILLAVYKMQKAESKQI